MYPIHFEPVYQDYIWGGNRIARKYKRPPVKGKTAESWEIANRKEGMSVVANGRHKGKTLQELIEEMGESLIGEGRDCSQFPLLLKIIDAKEDLSIQIHPNEDAAKELKGEAKTEMWVALEDSQVYAGLQEGIIEKQIIEAMKKKKLPTILEKHELHRGESVFVPGGLIHAICAGSLLLEIQQNSNTTYRMYDWDRVDEKGKPRALHPEQALAAIDWNNSKPAKITPHHLESDLHHQLVVLAHTPFFVTLRVDVFDEWKIPHTPKSFHLFFCIEGEAEITVDDHKEPFKPGMTYLVPAALKNGAIRGKCQGIWIHLP